MRGLSSRERRRRRWLGGLAGVLLVLPMAGCAGDFWDTVTSHDFEFKNLWTTDNPLMVLRDSDDGDKRAKAIRMLREPLQTGGTHEDQEFVMKILHNSAVSDRQPLCRLAAIQKLGTFKDPRAVVYLVEAFDNASEFPNSAVAGGKNTATTGMPTSIYSTAGISVDMPTQIRCQAITALGETHSPAALPRLMAVVREPGSVGADEDRQHALDVRLAAARALGNYKDQQAAIALADVFKKEKDVALHDRVYESLQASTGKKLPPDPAKWDALVHNQMPPNQVESDEGPRLVGWWQRLVGGNSNP